MDASDAKYFNNEFYLIILGYKSLHTQMQRAEIHYCIL